MADTQSHMGNQDQGSMSGQSRQGEDKKEQEGEESGFISSVTQGLPVDLTLLKVSIGEVSYPASREELVAAAEKSGAQSDVLDALKELPEQMYESAEEVVDRVKGK